MPVSSHVYPRPKQSAWAYEILIYVLLAVLTADLVLPRICTALLRTTMRAIDGRQGGGIYSSLGRRADGISIFELHGAMPRRRTKLLDVLCLPTVGDERRADYAIALRRGCPPQQFNDLPIVADIRREGCSRQFLARATSPVGRIAVAGSTKPLNSIDARLSRSSG